MKFGRTERARLLAIVVALTGFLNVISSLFPGTPERILRLHEILPAGIMTGSRSLTLATGFFIIAVAWNLASRRRMAWLIASWLLSVSAVSNVLKGLDVEEAVFSLLLLGVLWLFRRDFSVRSDPDAIENTFFAIPYAFIFFFLYAIAGFYILRHHFMPAFDVNGAIREAVNLATYQGAHIMTPLTKRARWFLESIPLISGISILYIMYNLMRPVLAPDPVTRRDRSFAASIVRKHGSGDISYFALGNDKNYFFNDNATCIIPYVLRNDVALSAGDPVGPEEEIAPIIDAFNEYCRENHWIPAFYQTAENTLDLYRESGLKSLKIGEKAIIDLENFDLKGKKKQDLRSAINRAERDGWKFEIYDDKIEDPQTASQIEKISEEWLKGKFGGEMGFVMGGAPVLGSDETLVSIAKDQDGRITAFATFAPMFGAKGWSLDFMRRVESAPGASMDYLITSTILYLKEKGEKILSLGMSPLAGVESENSEAFISLEKGMEIIYERVNTVYKFKSLHSFKEKYEPRWENCYLIYQGLANLPRVVYALVNAQMPDFSLGGIAKLALPPTTQNAKK